MEQKFQSSFIPKKQAEAGNFVSKVKRPATVFYWLGLIVFFLTIILAVTLFAYERFVLVKQLDAKKQDIQREIDSFDKELTQNLTILKQRIDAGEVLLSRHVSAGAVFSLVETLTSRNIYFDEFSFTAVPGESANISAHGEAPSYAALAFQSDTLKESDLILEPVFSELNLNDKGKVVFNLESSVALKVVSYRENLLTSLAPQEVLIEEVEELEPTDEESSSEQN